VCRNGTELCNYGKGLYSSELEAKRAEEVIRYTNQLVLERQEEVMKGKERTLLIRAGGQESRGGHQVYESAGLEQTKASHELHSRRLLSWHRINAITGGKKRSAGTRYRCDVQ